MQLTFLGIDLANISCLKLVLGQLSLLLDPLLVSLCKENKLFHLFHVVLTLLVEVTHFQGFGPYMLVEVHQHVLFQSGLAVINRNAVVVSVETVNQSLNGRLVEVTQVGSCLARLLAHDHRLGLDETECINDNLALH